MVRLITPARASLAVVAIASQSSPATACFFGTFHCGDGETICLNPITAAKCAFDAVCPIRLDDIVTKLGDAIKMVTPDEIDFVIDLGIKEVNGVFSDFRDCFKAFEGKIPKCAELHTVHACVSAALDVASGMDSEFAKLAASKLTKANKALSIIEGDIIPALNKQCASGCLNEDSCPAVTASSTPATTADCDDSATAATADDSITLEYSPPEGCTCLAMNATAYDMDAVGHTTDMCARNIAYMMEDVGVLAGKAYLPEMGCFVGKNTANGCSGAQQLQESEVDYSGELDWNENELQFMYFISCEDQYGRKYSERTNTVVTPAPATGTSCSNTTTTSDKNQAASATTLSIMNALLLGAATGWLAFI